MSQKINNISDAQANTLVRMAWEDRTTFDQIKERSGLSEADVIKLMRRELKPCSFVLWRKRVNGRITKHRKLFERHIKPSY